MKDVHDIIREWQRHPTEKFALATLVRARGSSYRRAGARMLIAPDGRSVGSLSGGCLEEEVAQIGREVLLCGEPRLTSFDTRRRFGCNGAIDIFVERFQNEFAAEVAAHLRARERCLAATIFEPAAKDAGSRVIEFEDANIESAFVQEVHPPLRLLVYGDGPDSAALHTIGAALGWEIVSIANASESPAAIDPWTAAIVKSHNYGRDCAALRALLPLPLRYVGLVGPRRRRDQLLGDLLDSGVVLNADLFAPAGLDLAADNPEEIALTIVAEIQAVFAGGTRASLRETKHPIHSARENPSVPVS